MTERSSEVGESATRRIVRRRSWGLCEICGKKPATDMAHRIGRGVGGPWNPSNIIDACSGCHHGNHHHPAAAYASGQHLQSHQDPRSTAALLIVRGVKKRVLLDDAGGYGEPAADSFE